MDKGLIIHALLINGSNEALLIRRAATEDVLPGAWDIPGGTLEDGEDPMAGAIRETKEEVGIDVDRLSVFAYTSNVDETKNKQFVRMIFVGRVDQSDVTLNPEDHDKYKWHPLTEAVEDMKLVDYLPNLISSLKEKSHVLFQI